MKNIFANIFILSCYAIFLSSCEKSYDLYTNIESAHPYVDMGLSVKWAVYNVGATQIEEYGDYFAWGEIEGKKKYSWSTYKYGEAYNQLTKYTGTWSSYAKDNQYDNLTTLELIDDAAHVNWGGRWRLPTPAEMNELMTNCHSRESTVNGIKGLIFKANNGNVLFFPYAGIYEEEKQFPVDVGTTGYFWTNSCSSYSNEASLYKIPYISYPDETDLERCLGLSIRAVCE